MGFSELFSIKFSAQISRIVQSKIKNTDELHADVDVEHKCFHVG